MCRTPPRAIRLLLLLGIFSLHGLWASGQECDKIASDYYDAVVSITVNVEHKETGAVQGPRRGTGFIVNKDGHVLTANHVIDADLGMYEVEIKGAIGSRHGHEYPLRLIKNSKEHDIALLKFSGGPRSFKFVHLGNPSSVRPGQSLCSLGYPAVPNLDQLPSGGMLRERNGQYNVWFTDMPSSEGESGGPVFDVATSKVVAMKNGTINPASVNIKFQGLNSLTPLNLVRTLLEDYADVRLPSNDPQQNTTPTLLCVESPDDARTNPADMTLEAEGEELEKTTRRYKSWKPSASAQAAGPKASAEARVELTCHRGENDYVLGVTAQHSSMAGWGGTSRDYRPSISTIRGYAHTGFIVERGNYCLVITQYEQDGERKKGYLDSNNFHEGQARPSLIVLKSPSGKLIDLKPGISVPLEDKGLWRFMIDVDTSHRSRSRDDSGSITMRNLLRFRFSGMGQGNECPPQGGNTPPK